MEPPDSRPGTSASGAPTEQSTSSPNRPKLVDLNEQFCCKLCFGYMIDPTTITDCMHSFCRSCILRYFTPNGQSHQSSSQSHHSTAGSRGALAHTDRRNCPVCEAEVNITQLGRYLKRDAALQSIIYKVVPGLYKEELQRRRDFYVESCRRHNQTRSPGESKSAISNLWQRVFDRQLVDFAGVLVPPDELVSLCLRYDPPADCANAPTITDGCPPALQPQLHQPQRHDVKRRTVSPLRLSLPRPQSSVDQQQQQQQPQASPTRSASGKKSSAQRGRSTSRQGGRQSKSSRRGGAGSTSRSPGASRERDSSAQPKIDKEDKGLHEERGPSFKRYFQCQAAVTVAHLKKLLQYKLELPTNYTIVMSAGGHTLLDTESLCDVAYMCKWRRQGPLVLSFGIYQLAPDEPMPTLLAEAVPDAAAAATAAAAAQPQPDHARHDGDAASTQAEAGHLPKQEVQPDDGDADKQKNEVHEGVEVDNELVGGGEVGDAVAAALPAAAAPAQQTKLPLPVSKPNPDPPARKKRKPSTPSKRPAKFVAGGGGGQSQPIAVSVSADLNSSTSTSAASSHGVAGRTNLGQPSPTDLVDRLLIDRVAAGMVAAEPTGHSSSSSPAAQPASSTEPTVAPSPQRAPSVVETPANDTCDAGPAATPAASVPTASSNGGATEEPPTKKVRCSATAYPPVTKEHSYTTDSGHIQQETATSVSTAPTTGRPASNAYASNSIFPTPAAQAPPASTGFSAPVAGNNAKLKKPNTQPALKTPPKKSHGSSKGQGTAQGTSGPSRCSSVAVTRPTPQTPALSAALAKPMPRPAANHSVAGPRPTTSLTPAPGLAAAPSTFTMPYGAMGVAPLQPLEMATFALAQQWAQAQQQQQFRPPFFMHPPMNFNVAAAQHAAAQHAAAQHAAHQFAAMAACATALAYGGQQSVANPSSAPNVGPVAPPAANAAVPIRNRQPMGKSPAAGNRPSASSAASFTSPPSAASSAFAASSSTPMYAVAPSNAFPQAATSGMNWWMQQLMQPSGRPPGPASGPGGLPPPVAGGTQHKAAAQTNPASATPTSSARK